MKQFPKTHLAALLIAVAFIATPHAWHLPPSIFIFFSILLIWHFINMAFYHHLEKAMAAKQNFDLSSHDWWADDTFYTTSYGFW